MRRAFTIFGLLAVIAIVHGTLQKAGAFAEKPSETIQLETSIEQAPDSEFSVFEGLKNGLNRFWLYSGFANAKAGNLYKSDGPVFSLL